MYLVTQPGFEPFLTRWFDMENHWVDGMVVFSNDLLFYCDDGKTWKVVKTYQL